MPKKHEPMLLMPQLVPRPLVGRSVYKALGRGKEWQNIRDSVIDVSEGACQICGVKREKNMICHELWEYDDENHIAQLTNFNLICPDCNLVIHVGGSGNIWGGDPTGGLSAESSSLAIDHLIMVNHIKLKQAIELLVQANHVYDERSIHQWEVEISRDLVESFPILAEIEL